MADKKGTINLTSEEKEQIENFREIGETRKACAKEINIVLEKFNAELRVDPGSQLGNLQIMVVIKKASF